MAKREFTVDLTDRDILEWRRVGSPLMVDGLMAEAAFAFDVQAVHASLRSRVFAYGVKQIIADGGALEKNAPIGEKLAMMEKRANALRNGTWGTRQAPTLTITDDLAIATLAKSMGKTPDEIRAMLATTDEEPS